MVVRRRIGASNIGSTGSQGGGTIITSAGDVIITNAGGIIGVSSSGRQDGDIPKRTGVGLTSRGAGQTAITAITVQVDMIITRDKWLKRLRKKT